MVVDTRALKSGFHNSTVTPAMPFSESAWNPSATLSSHTRFPSA